jgi:serine/threonine protein kinase
LQSDKIHQIGTYRLGKTIGEGSFGKVKIAHHILTGQQVAIKIVDKINAPQLVREVPDVSDVD